MVEEKWAAATTSRPKLPCWGLGTRKNRHPSQSLNTLSLCLCTPSGEGNGTPLQYSCLGNPMDGGAWYTTVHGATKSQTGLSDFAFTFMHWRRKWQPTPVFLPGESQGRGAWCAAVYGVAQSGTRLTRLSSNSSMHTFTDFTGCSLKTLQFFLVF